MFQCSARCRHDMKDRVRINVDPMPICYLLLLLALVIECSSRNNSHLSLNESSTLFSLLEHNMRLLGAPRGSRV